MAAGLWRPERQRIVVVDDDEDIRMTISFVLECDGFRVSTFEDGLSALEQVREAPDLVLLDYMMPRLNAVGFLNARRNHPALRDVPVVVISAFPELADTVAEQTVGVLHKPIDREILLECARYHCDRPRPPK